MRDIFSFYKEHPKTRDPKDYWGQVMRIVDGKPVGEEQIQLIVDAVLTGLDLQADDVLVDLCCGNGALTDRFFARCQGGFGVDFSPTLIEVAQRDFQVPGRREYQAQDALEFVLTAADTARFTKALCYGSLVFFSDEAVGQMLDAMRVRFPNVQTFMIGNLPDRSKVKAFFQHTYRPGIEDDVNGATGIWRNEEDLVALAQRCGWNCVISRMPKEFYAARYRYDAILTRQAG